MSDYDNSSQEMNESERKPKRQMTEKQLANLAKARAVRLQQRKLQKETTQKKKQIKKLQKEKESKAVDTDYQQLLLELDELQLKSEHIGKAKEKSKKKKVVFEESDEEDSDDESEEIVVRKVIKKKPKRPVQRQPKPAEPVKDMVRTASKEIVTEKINRLRNDLLYKTIFPEG